MSLCPTTARSAASQLVYRASPAGGSSAATAAFTVATSAGTSTRVGARLVLPAAGASVAKLATAMADGVPASASTNASDASFMRAASAVSMDPERS